MPFWNRKSRSTSEIAKPAQFGQLSGDALLAFAQGSLTGLAEALQDVAGDNDASEDAERAIDRLFAFMVVLGGAGEEDWRRFSAFAITEVIPRWERQNDCLREIQIKAEPSLRALQARTGRWAEDELGTYIASLPNDWFRFHLSGGEVTRPDGLKTNCLHVLTYGAIALASFDDADESDFRTLYVPVQPLVPIESVLALAA